MNRRTVSFAAAVTILAGLLTACGSTSDADVVAEVNGTVLTQAQLQKILPSAAADAATTDPTAQDTTATSAPTDTSAPKVGDIDRAEAKQAIDLWVWNQALRHELELQGQELPEPSGLDDYTGIGTDAQAAFDALLAFIQSSPPTPEESQARYDALVCLNAAQSGDLAEANAFADKFNDGGGLADLGAQEGSTGFLGCTPPEAVGGKFAGAVTPETLTAITSDLATLEPGKALPPIELAPEMSPDGAPAYIVVQRATFDEVNATAPEAFTGPDVIIAQAVGNSDITIASMYGTFGPQGLTPLGQ